MCASFLQFWNIFHCLYVFDCAYADISIYGEDLMRKVFSRSDKKLVISDYWHAVYYIFQPCNGSEERRTAQFLSLPLCFHFVFCLQTTLTIIYWVSCHWSDLTCIFLIRRIQLCTHIFCTIIWSETILISLSHSYIISFLVQPQTHNFLILKV